jgi:CelD/BcsL family acetyltransferase involved in cellulose biosynthesis
VPTFSRSGATQSGEVAPQSRCSSRLLIAIVIHSFFFPSASSGARGLRVLTFLDGTVSDYNAAVVFEGARHWNEAAIADIWRDIQARLPPFDVAILKKMPDTVEDWPNPLESTSRRTKLAAHSAQPRQKRDSKIRDRSRSGNGFVVFGSHDSIEAK